LQVPDLGRGATSPTLGYVHVHVDGGCLPCELLAAGCRESAAEMKSRRFSSSSLALSAISIAALAVPDRSRAEDIPVQLSVGETATLQLDGSASTGYSWHLKGPPDQYQQVLDIQVVGYTKPALAPGEQPLLGAPQKFQIVLTGIDAGRANLVFNYVKAGETSPAKTQAYKIEVLDDATVSDDQADDGSPKSMSRDLFPSSEDDRDAGGPDNQD
jgi:predicted secreted protein